MPRLGRRRGLVGADPAQRAEDRRRVGGDRRQHPLAVLVDQALGAGRADVAQRGQVGDPALAVGGVERQRAARPQLPAVARVGLPVAAHFGPVAGVEVGDRADQREALAGLHVLYLEHRVAVVLGAEDRPPAPRRSPAKAAASASKRVAVPSITLLSALGCKELAARMAMSNGTDRLPHVDEHSIGSRPTVAAAWDALLLVAEASVSAGGAPRLARSLGCADIERRPAAARRRLDRSRLSRRGGGAGPSELRSPDGIASPTTR